MKPEYLTGIQNRNLREVDKRGTENSLKGFRLATFGTSLAFRRMMALEYYEFYSALKKNP